MKKEIKRLLNENGEMLLASDKTLKSIFDIMFRNEDLILTEGHDGFRIIKNTYGEIKRKIMVCAKNLYGTLGAGHGFVALNMDNSPDWIVAFWAILMSGNKPYLVNLRYPDSLTNGILKTLNVTHIVSDTECSINGEVIRFADLLRDSDTVVPDDCFEDEIAFSSSATSMNEVVCFYHGAQISAQILNFKGIVKKDPSIAAHYKGSLKQLAFLPFYHVFGLFAVYFWFTFFGRTLVFLRDYSADTILKTCRRHEVTHIFAVPVLWHTIEKQIISSAKEKGEKTLEKLQKGLKFTTALQNIFPRFGAYISKLMMREITDKLFGRSIMFLINGGSYLRDSALYLLNGIGYNMHNGYGMSEIGITSVELRRKAKERNENSIGHPFDSVEYRLGDDGTLMVKGTSLCQKKLTNGEPILLDGWFDTKDVMTEIKGNWFISGRMGDVVIGENGENINPDMIESRFNVPLANAISVLGMEGKDGQELSLIASVNSYISNDRIEAIKREVYTINETLPTATAIRKFYFTFDPLCPPTAVKVSRTQLLKNIENGSVKLTPFAEMTATASNGEESRLMADVVKIIAKVLGVEGDKISPDTHLFYDLGATSIQYFTCLTQFAEHFSIANYEKTDKYCYTPKEICEYIERHL